MNGRIVYVANSTVEGSPRLGIFGSKVTVVNSTVRAHADEGVSCSKCEIVDSTISGNTGNGIACAKSRQSGGAYRPAGKAEVQNSFVVDNGGHGIGCARRVRLQNSEVSRNGGDGVTVNGCTSFQNRGGGGCVGRVLSFSSTINDNTRGGIDTKQAKATLTSIKGNGGNGVEVWRRVVLIASNVTGNVTDPTSCASSACGDIRSATVPRLLDGSTCGTSADFGTGTWGVCSLD